MTAGLAAAAVLLLLLGALFSAAESAAFSIGASRLRTLLDEGFNGATELQRLQAHSGPAQAAGRLLATILNLVAAGLTVVMGATVAGVWGASLALLPGVAAVLFVGEILPRALAARYPIRLALAAAPVLLALERWVRLALSPIVKLELLLSGRAREELTSDEREILEMSELGQAEGVVDPDEHILVERAFRLDELTAWDVMTPRVDVFAWEDSIRLSDIVEELSTVPYSRVPVYDASMNNVTGVLYVREAYETIVAGRDQSTLAEIAREPFFVPGSLSLTQLLRDFQARRIHMGVVADEFGGTDGIVTLEDVIEQLVGEIVDETDVEGEPLMRIARDEIVAQGNADLREVNYAFNVSLPQLEHRSVNGFILEELGYVPEKGETLERSGLFIEVLEANETQVIRARLRRLPFPEDANMRNE
ncbi:MAG TPA: hemolysin family protein [Longimicrobiales bacterium]